jgi:hypothetical protein
MVIAWQQWTRDASSLQCGIGTNTKFIGMDFMLSTCGQQADNRNAHHPKVPQGNRIRHLPRLSFLALAMPVLTVSVS